MKAKVLAIAIAILLVALILPQAKAIGGNKYLQGDANFDGIVDIFDLALMGGCYGGVNTTYPYGGSGHYYPDCDFNKDGYNNIYDVVILQSHWEQTTDWHADIMKDGEIIAECNWDVGDWGYQDEETWWRYDGNGTFHGYIGFDSRPNCLMTCQGSTPWHNRTIYWDPPALVDDKALYLDLRIKYYYDWALGWTGWGGFGADLWLYYHNPTLGKGTWAEIYIFYELFGSATRHYLTGRNWLVGGDQSLNWTYEVYPKEDIPENTWYADSVNINYEILWLATMAAYDDPTHYGWMDDPETTCYLRGVDVGMEAQWGFGEFAIDYIYIYTEG